MADIDCHTEMTDFHGQKVTLSQKQQTDMGARRDAGRTRLRTGLGLKDRPLPEEMASQGSYQMRTMTQDDENDYDIDDGAYFDENDLADEDNKPLTPLAARERVCDALKWDGRFRQEATVKRNCVRQEYAAGYHIDVPVYRIVTTDDDDGNEVRYFELASGDQWVESDARAVTRWFNDRVKELNSGDRELQRGESDGSQMRRVTKITKKFARSRKDWKTQTTSGICMTKLVVDHFVCCTGRDDQALRETWKAVRIALDASTEIGHPVLEGEGTNLAEAGDAEVGFLRDCLVDALETLEALDDPNVTRAQVRKAWGNVFNTSFFTDQPDNGASKKGEAPALVVTSSETARRNDGGGRFG